MSQTLTGLGTLTYNGCTFGGPRLSTSVTATPVRDKANRTVSYTLFAIAVKVIVTDDATGFDGNTVTAGGNAANSISTIRSSLSKDGGKLYFSGYGHGLLDVVTGGDTFEVNTNATNRDVKFGPKITGLQFKPIGANAAFEVSFTIEVALAECGTQAPNRVGVLGNILALNFTATYSVDMRGLTTRTISGYMQIMLNRTTASVLDATLPFTADDYRARIAPTIPVDFRRQSQNYTLSEDKSTLDFQIVDTEMPSDNAFPVGVADIQVSHTINTVGPTMVLTNGTFSGSIEMVKGFDLATGWTRLTLMLKERMDFMRAQPGTGFHIVRGLSVTEEIFARRLSFTLNYEQTVKNGLQGPSHFVIDAGMFLPVGTTDITQWSQSMQGTAWHQRGVAGLRFNVAADPIVDPCVSIQGNVVGNSLTSSYFGTPSDFFLNPSNPPKASSYREYHSYLTVSDNRNTIEHKPMPTAPAPTAGPPAVTGSDAYISASAPYAFAPSKVQALAAKGGIEITLHGYGSRYGYPVEIPNVVNGLNSTADITPVRQRIANTVLGDFGGCLLYGGAWAVTYLVNVDYTTLSNTIGTMYYAILGTADDPYGYKVRVGQ